MKTSHKMWLLFSAVIFLFSITLKVYFMPYVEDLLRVTIQHQMKQEILSLEKIIHTVVNIAGKEKSIVRQALFAIGSDPDIQVKLRRSHLIQKEYGFVKSKAVLAGRENAVYQTGQAHFWENEKQFQYIYPLKANHKCQNCHVNSQGEPVKVGTVMGLAVKTNLKKSINSTNVYFYIYDIFWGNIVFIALGCVVLLGGVYAWYELPLEKLIERSKLIMRRAEENFEDGFDELERQAGDNVSEHDLLSKKHEFANLPEEHDSFGWIKRALWLKK